MVFCCCRVEGGYAKRDTRNAKRKAWVRSYTGVGGWLIGMGVPKAQLGVFRVGAAA